MACDRRLRGAYVDSDALQSRLSALERRAQTAADQADEILAMVATTKQQEYGEDVDMLAHSLQAADLAARSGADRDVIVAALCHDVGGAEAVPSAVGFDASSVQMVEDVGGQIIGVSGHHTLGYAFMKQMGASEDVASLVRGHVDAKRYLVATDDAYFARLSKASVGTLEEQGGPMSGDEVAAFESNHLFETMLQMRTWDEEAKDPDKSVPPLWSYHKLVAESLRAAGRELKPRATSA